jgi:predicted component of type VI protein secretion system
VVVTAFDAFTLGMAGIHLGIHNMLTNAERGHISPSDVDMAIDGMMETLENLSPELLASVVKNLDPLLANLKTTAAANWKGGA